MMPPSSGDDGGIGPIGPKTGPGGPGAAESTGALEGSEAAAADDAPDSVTAVGSTGAEPADAAIANALRTGEIDAASAKELLIDAVAREQLGADASADAVEALKAELAEALEGDPAFESLSR